MSITKTREVFSLPNVHYTHFNNILLGVKYSAPLVLTVSTHGAKHPHDVCGALIRQ